MRISELMVLCFQNCKTRAEAEFSNSIAYADAGSLGFGNKAIRAPRYREGPLGMSIEVHDWTGWGLWVPRGY